MIILKIILAIIIIAAAVGVIATVADLLGKKSAHKPYGPYERFVKRGLDAFLATGALIVLSPVLLVTAILVRVKLGSPVLFTQERPGRDGKIFILYKFRTMLGKSIANTLGKAVSNTVSATSGIYKGVNLGANVGANFARSSNVTKKGDNRITI